MVKKESKEVAEVTSSRSSAPNAERAEKESKGLLKTRSSKQQPSIEEMGNRSVADQLQGKRPVKEKMKRTRPKRQPVEEIGVIHKEYLKSDSSCRVTFRLSKDAVGSADKVAIVGEFNEWDAEASVMKRRSDGAHEITLELRPGREYRFWYIIDGHRWENDRCADGYKQIIYGCDDSVVIV